MPVREDLQAGTVSGLPPWFIRNGQGGNEWLPVQHPQPAQAIPYEIYPAGEMPHVVNPSAGWFVNANNDPAGTVLDNDPLNQLRPGGGIYYLNPGYDGFRAGRITEMMRHDLGTATRSRSATSSACRRTPRCSTPSTSSRGCAVRSPTRRPAACRSWPRWPPIRAWPRRSTGWRGGISRRRPASRRATTRVTSTAGCCGRRPRRDREQRRRNHLRGMAFEGGHEHHRRTTRRFTDAETVPKPSQHCDTFSTPGPRHTGVGASGDRLLRDPRHRRSGRGAGLPAAERLSTGLDMLAGPPSTRHSTVRRTSRTTDGACSTASSSATRSVVRSACRPRSGSSPQPLPGLSGIPVDGGFETVDAASQTCRASAATGSCSVAGQRDGSSPHRLAMDLGGIGPAGRYQRAADQPVVPEPASAVPDRRLLPCPPRY